jgi:hypothetical protein
MKPAHLFTTIAVITVGVVDLAFVCFSGTGSSVSNFMKNVGFNSPAIVFAIGFICGHLFGPMKAAEK